MLTWDIQLVWTTGSVIFAIMLVIKYMIEPIKRKGAAEFGET